MADQKEELTPQEEADLFEAFEEAEEEVESAKSDLAEKEQGVSDAVQEIHEKLGSGPFVWKGKTVRVSKRKEIYSLREVKEKKTRTIGG